MKVDRELRYNKIMNNATNQYQDDECPTGCDCIHCADDSIDSYVPPPPPSPKDQFKGLLGTIQAACASVDARYDEMIEKARPFDRELVQRLEACRASDKAILDYVRSKTEEGVKLPSNIVVGLLGR